MLSRLLKWVLGLATVLACVLELSNLENTLINDTNYVIHVQFKQERN
jgi:hypothetical protein